MLVRTYVKRQRMEAPLRHVTVPIAPPSVVLVPWDVDLLESHAEVKWQSFRDTVDAAIFPNLGRLDGCLQLMRTIAVHEGFVPQATWLAQTSSGYVGCVQGVKDGRRSGMIQNLAVVDGYRGQGIGKALLSAALTGFANAGLKYAQLEVSASNTPAVRLYEGAGFRVRKTLYRETRTEVNEYAI
jgi:ribosomal protein S18 acetylase RimI-like enzyme